EFSVFVAEYFHPACIGFKFTCQYFNRGRLTGTARSEQPEYFPTPDFKFYSIQRALISENFLQTFCSYNRFHCPYLLTCVDPSLRLMTKDRDLMEMNGWKNTSNCVI